MTTHFEPNGETQLLALFGAALRHSPSPATHTSWARSLGLNLQYTAMQTDGVEDFMALVQALLKSPHFAGGNITHPFKAASLKLKDVRIDESARICGAANTIYRTMGTLQSGWSLTNTDLAGCSDSLKEILSENDSTPGPVALIILGGGAMMRTYLCAVKNYSLLHGTAFDIHIAIRSSKESLQKTLEGIQSSNFNIRFIHLNSPDWKSVGETYQSQERRLLCINTLPGKTSQDAELTTLSVIRALDQLGSWTSKNLLCVNYGSQNSWQQLAAGLGWKVLNGDLLFEKQARTSFKLWTGLDAPNHPAAQPPS